MGNVTLRLQDILFGLLGLLLLSLMVLHIGVIVLAMVGAFACGALTLLAGMLPTRDQGFLDRAFTTVFLSLVLSSLVLILPATLGSPHPEWQKTVLTIAGLPPVVAICFEVVRTPWITRTILRGFGLR